MEEMTGLFVYILAHHVKDRVIINRFMCFGETISWEGSTADSRVLRDAISRRHGLKVFIILLMLDIPIEMDFLPYIEASGIT
ncbi:hypothetical protein L1049_025873 [Liquidambar formosana]|uniref:Uncharacterized protein n=1 Tax=Liquidambar formosana TaxID=63359 RepID=A0AAP0NC33_LIQFO